MIKTKPQEQITYREERGKTMERHYYGAYSYMGTSYDLTAPCWVVYRFPSRADRDAWVAENPTHKRAVTAREARKIIGGEFETEPDGMLVRSW